MKIHRATPLSAFQPELFLVLRAGYRGRDLRADMIAGLTVAIVALPLSMAIAIASGVRPEAGLITAIIGGIIVSLFGGSRYQIAGPAGAFIVLVAATVARHGPEGLAVATFLSGILLALMGLLRAGRFIRYIPYPVTIGFTAGIGLIILASQLRPFLGIELAGAEPGPVIAKVSALWDARATLSPAAVAVAGVTLLTIWVFSRYLPRLPGLLIAIILASAIAALLHLPVATIGSEFGGLPTALPAPQLPSWSSIAAIVPDALAFTLLGAIESLLSATVADGMSGRRHNPDSELAAQGLANIASGVFGGIPVTGTIARTATNVRAGARSPLAGVIHAVVLLLIVVLFADLVALVPLAALAGVLVWVSLHMVGLRTIVSFVRAARAEAFVLLTTLGLTLFHDLTEGIVVGVALSALVIARRLSQAMVVTTDQSHTVDTSDPEVATVLVSGAFFFGSAPVVETVLEQIGPRPERLVLDLSEVSVMDSSAAQVVMMIIERASKQTQMVEVRGARPDVLKALKLAGYSPPGVPNSSKP